MYKSSKEYLKSHLEYRQFLLHMNSLGYTVY